VLLYSTVCYCVDVSYCMLLHVPVCYYMLLCVTVCDCFTVFDRVLPCYCMFLCVTVCYYVLLYVTVLLYSTVCYCMLLCVTACSCVLLHVTVCLRSHSQPVSRFPQKSPLHYATAGRKRTILITAASGGMARRERHCTSTGHRVGPGLSTALDVTKLYRSRDVR